MGEESSGKACGKRLLEDALNVFIESLVRRAYQAKALRAQREREAEERRVAEEKRKEADDRNRQELARMERFDTLAGAVEGF